MVVLKGIELKGVYSKIIDLINKDSKIQYYYENIFSQKRRIIYYDEYLILKELIKRSNNNKIAVLDNNLYINYYPLISEINNEILEILINNDIEEKEVEYCEKRMLNKDIGIYTTVFSSVIKINNQYYCIYNDDIDEYTSVEEIQEDCFKLYNQNISDFEKSSNKNYKIFEITEEIDYLTFLQKSKSIEENIYLDISWNKEIVEQKIKLLNTIYGLRFEIYLKKIIFVNMLRFIVF